MNNRQEVMIELATVDLYDIDGFSMREVSDFFLNYGSSDSYRDVCACIETSYGNNGEDIVIKGTRLENDTEYDQRMTKEKRISDVAKMKSKQKETQDYKEYLRLKQKFENV